jgi:hypothetical protein
MIYLIVLGLFIFGCAKPPVVEIETRPVNETSFDSHIKKLNKYYKDKYRGQPQSR